MLTDFKLGLLRYFNPSVSTSLDASGKTRSASQTPHACRCQGRRRASGQLLIFGRRLPDARWFVFAITFTSLTSPKPTWRLLRVGRCALNAGRWNLGTGTGTSLRAGSRLRKGMRARITQGNPPRAAQATAPRSMPSPLRALTELGLEDRAHHRGHVRRYVELAI